LFAGASIYWHAGGLGEDPERHPERFEHFGITVVEAMAAGAVPVVFAAAGPQEIVTDGVHGFHWRTPEELVRRTRQLIDDPELRRRMSDAARQRAEDFSAPRFTSAVRALVPADQVRLRT
jgi:glycosyltransferase involved in cell wall biosynthesis